MNMSRFILVRHGETEGNKRGLFYGSRDLPLTDFGHQQAQKVSSYLKDIQIDKVITSQLQRAKQTAEYIRSSHSHRHDCDARLNEMHFGDWEMSHYSEIALNFPQDWAHWMHDWKKAKPTNGEPTVQFAKRVLSVADDLRQEAIEKPATRLIVAHKGVLGLIIAHWFGLSLEAMWQFPCKQDAYSLIECHHELMTLAIFNGRSYLPPIA